MSESEQIKILAITPTPRWVPAICEDARERALKPFGISTLKAYGVFWGPVMQRSFEKALDKGVDWILTIDGDSMFFDTDLDRLIGTFGSHPEIDALCALQMRRGKEMPLFTRMKETSAEITGQPLKVTTAHFGLTLFRAEAFASLPKPWFKEVPDESGEWGDDRIDSDIWFWREWEKAGNSVYLDPTVSIGHLEEVVSYYDEELNPQHDYPQDWRERRCLQVQ